MMAYYDKATNAVEVSNGQLTWNKIRESTNDLVYKLSSMKFEDPADGEAVLRERYMKLNKEIEDKFRAILDTL
jgi:V-type H+-transporting ATPase subunit A